MAGIARASSARLLIAGPPSWRRSDPPREPAFAALGKPFEQALKGGDAIGQAHDVGRGMDRQHPPRSGRGRFRRQPVKGILQALRPAIRRLLLDRDDRPVGQFVVERQVDQAIVEAMGISSFTQSQQ